MCHSPSDKGKIECMFFAFISVIIKAPENENTDGTPARIPENLQTIYDDLPEKYQRFCDDLRTYGFVLFCLLFVFTYIRNRDLHN